MRTNNTNTVAIEINAESGVAPKWVQLTPAGRAIVSRDGRMYMQSNQQNIINAFQRNDADLPVDFEHATEIKGSKGEPAPAVGWIKALEVRHGAIWAHVEWNDIGRDHLISKAYRYISPVFKFEKATGEILAMVSAGLTNKPNFKMTALCRQNNNGDTIMEPTVLEALGLKKDATPQDVVSAIHSIKADRDTAKNSAKAIDTSSFVPRADHDLALNKIKAFEEVEVKRGEAAIVAAVDAATKDGKIAPSTRDYHLAACRQDGGLDRFKNHIKTAPSITDPSGLDKNPTENSSALSAEEKATCRATGISEADFATAKEEQKS